MLIFTQPKKSFCLVITLLTLLNVKAQERITLGYKVGISALDSTQKRIIINTIHNYSNYSIDSVIIKGFADSLGNQKANLELSKDRAKDVMHYMKKTISYKIKYKYYAVGEQNKKIENIDRRVEIYIYAKANNNDTFLDTIPDSITLSHPKCITTAYDVLALSRKFVIKKKKAEYVVVEMEIDHYLSRKRIKDSIY